MSGNWTNLENDLIVASYLDMLKRELAGETFVKREHNRRVREHLDRSHASVEFKWQNVSAVLMGMGLPWIEGYKPKPNFQGSLVDAVIRAGASNAILGAPKPKPGPIIVELDVLNHDAGAEQMLQMMPIPSASDLSVIADRSRKLVAGFFDASARDARNRMVGEVGEDIVLRHEKRRLREAGRADLSDAVEWVSKTRGDGLGYDIASFTTDGEPRKLEVKTTPGYATTPFHISRNERGAAERDTDSWRLVRVWDVRRAPKAFVLEPPLDEHLGFTAESFSARLILAYT